MLEGLSEVEGIRVAMKARLSSEAWFHALGTFHLLSYKTRGFCLPAWQDAVIS